MNAGIITGTDFSLPGLSDCAERSILIGSAAIRFAEFLFRAICRRERWRRNAPRSTKPAPSASIIPRFVEKLRSEKWTVILLLPRAVQFEGEPKKNNALNYSSGISDFFCCPKIRTDCRRYNRYGENLCGDCDVTPKNQRLRKPTDPTLEIQYCWEATIAAVPVSIG
jgi:hypothetical protein